jgi:hypothetical protein
MATDPVYVVGRTCHFEGFHSDFFSSRLGIRMVFSFFPPSRFTRSNCLGLWEAMPVIGKSENKAARCLKAAMQWCLFWRESYWRVTGSLVNVLKRTESADALPLFRILVTS